MLSIKDIFEEAKNRNVPYDNIMHLGANLAQNRKEYIENGVKEILWVEALPDLALQLSRTLPASDKVVQAVLSDKSDQEVVFNIASNGGASSSVFDFKLHTSLYPNIRMQNQITLRTKTLDDVFEDHNISYQKYKIMIMDLQGSELKTLKGAPKVLNSLEIVVSEVLCSELYEGAPLESDIDIFLSAQGFKKIAASYTKYQWGEAIYVKNNI